MKRVVFAVVAAAICAGCAGRVPGSLVHSPQNPALVRAPGPLSLAVELPKDERPLEEKTGLAPQTTTFLFLLFMVYSATRGNLVTSPIELGPNPLGDLHKLTLDYLARSSVFTRVVPAGAPSDLVLRARVHHLFAARYVSTAFMLAVSKNSSDVRSSKSQHAPFGNAVVTYELVDKRGGKDVVVWKDTLLGFAAGRPEDHEFRTLSPMATAATSSLLNRLARALHLASDRLLARDSAASPPAVNDGFQFYVQRTDARREGIDLVKVEYPSGKVALSRRIEADSLPPGRPGEWLLSRRLPSGELVAGARYEAMARTLASKFDLRRIDDAYFYHFFGLKGRRPPPPPPLPGAMPPPPPPPAMQ